jgi:hypothetical protein
MAILVKCTGVVVDNTYSKYTYYNNTYILLFVKQFFWLNKIFECVEKPAQEGKKATNFVTKYKKILLYNGRCCRTKQKSGISYRIKKTPNVYRRPPATSQTRPGREMTRVSGPITISASQPMRM